MIDKYELKHIKLIGATSDISYYYRKTSLYVSTARFEGLPMTMIEAQSFGLPIISFDYDTGPADIIHSGYDGFIIERNDIDSMITKMSEVLLKSLDKSKIDLLSKASYESSKSFEISKIINKWNLIIENQQEWSE